jgi:hypothetical protein
MKDSFEGPSCAQDLSPVSVSSVVFELGSSYANVSLSEQFSDGLRSCNWTWQS